MIKIANEVKVGILAIAGLVLLFFGYKYLKGSAFFNSEHVYYAEYNDVGGLLVGNPVQIQGVKVGTVESIDFIQENPSDTKVKVGLRVSDDIMIPKKSNADIVSTGLMGNIVVSIIYPVKDSLPNPLTYLADGDLLSGKLSGGMMETMTQEIAPIRDKSTKLMTSLDSVSVAINNILRSSRMDNTLTNVDKSFVTLEKTLHNLNAISAQMQSIMSSEAAHIKSITTNADLVSSNFVQSSKKLDGILDQAATISANAAKADISGTTEQLKTTLVSTQSAIKDLQSMLNQINSGQGSAGKLMKDEALYANLERASANLDKLFIDLKENPSDYVNFSLIKIGRRDKK